jgi:hypothetical protein
MNISLNTVNHVVDLAEEYRASQPPPSDEPVQLFAGDVSLDLGPAHANLYNFIDDLPDDQKHELSAIVWLGRGDSNNFEEAVRESQAHSPKTTAFYLSGMADLAGYLRSGVNKL